MGVLGTNSEVTSSIFDVPGNAEAAGADGTGLSGIVPIKIGYSLTTLRCLGKKLTYSHCIVIRQLLNL